MKVNQVIHGDALEELKELPTNSVDSVVTDPPYGIGFMGEDWDTFTNKEYQEFCYQWGQQCLRVLKPGGFLLAFSGCRTYHRMVVGLEDAGFHIHDQIDWIFGSGFPKGLDLSKAIDGALGKQSKGFKFAGDDGRKAELKQNLQYRSDYGYTYTPKSEEAQQWEGWKAGKQALKPAHEPICVAQKPVEGNYINNVLKWGVGGLNIDGCRIETDESLRGGQYSGKHRKDGVCYGKHRNLSPEDYKQPEGRFPPNLIIDEFVAKLLDEQSGDLQKQGSQKIKNTFSSSWFGGGSNKSSFYGDSGGASRYFKIVKPFCYVPKASSKERDAGLDDVDGEVTNRRTNKQVETKNNIPSLKPINLMRWLVRLVTPKNGLVLDPFAGSGTTGVACAIEGFNYILIEKQEKFAKTIIPTRIEYWSKERNQQDLPQHKELPKLKQERLEKWI